MRIADFELERFFAQWEFAATHLLCGSDVETHSLEELLGFASDAERHQFSSLRLGYTDPAGLRDLRVEIANLYDHGDPDRVYTFAGAEEAIFLVIHAFAGVGDHVIAFAPAYQSLYEVATAAGADLTLLDLQESEGWRIDPERVRQAVRPDTTLIVVNSPHNPTGYQMAPSDLAELVGIAEECGATLLSDEVYRFLEHDPGDRLPGQQIFRLMPSAWE